jgi:hypothetical protein
MSVGAWKGGAMGEARRQEIAKNVSIAPLPLKAGVGKELCSCAAQHEHDHVKFWIMWRTGDRYRRDNGFPAWYAT